MNQSSLVKKDNKTYRVSEVIIIRSRTNQARIQYDKDCERISYLEKRSVIDTQDYIGANLYFLSDEPVGDGDWYLGKTYSMDGEKISPTQFFVGTKPCAEIPGGKKIIATTDLLTTNEEITGKDISYGRAIYIKEKNAHYKCIPQPSKRYIDFYIEHFNAGHIIEETLIEYEFKSNTVIKVSYENPVLVPYYVLKINEDRTINNASFEDFRKEYTADDMKKCYIQAVQHYIKFGIEPTEDLASDYLIHLQNKKK
jgi:hypothetical protein